MDERKYLTLLWEDLERFREGELARLREGVEERFLGDRERDFEPAESWLLERASLTRITHLSKGLGISDLRKSDLKEIYNEQTYQACERESPCHPYG